MRILPLIFASALAFQPVTAQAQNVDDMPNWQEDTSSSSDNLWAEPLLGDLGYRETAASLEEQVPTVEIAQLSLGSGCAPSGGVQFPDAPPTDKEINIFGAGWGHGAGMSQYGAKGAVDLGCSYEQVLQTYFANTDIERVPWEKPIRVQVAPDVNTMTITLDEGEVPWQVCNKDGSNCKTVFVQKQGQTIKGERTQDSHWQISENGNVLSSLPGPAQNQLLRVKISDESDSRKNVVDVVEARYDDGKVNKYRWGHLDLMPYNDVSSTKGNLVLHVPNMELYLRGIGEISPRWDLEVQKVQAVASRTFVTNKLQTRQGSEFSAGCDCDIRSSTSDQYYRGWEQEEDNEIVGGGWAQAIKDTKDENLVIDGDPINAYFGAMSGGVVATGSLVWGGTEKPFSTIIDDSRWEQAANSPRTRWVKGFTAEELGKKLGIGTYKSYVINGETAPGGRISHEGVTFTGTKGSVTLDREKARWKLGLSSMWFRINEPLPVIPSGLNQGPKGNAGGKDNSPITDYPQHNYGQPSDIYKFATIDRISGKSRVLTAIASAKYWQHADEVVLAEEGDWQGALAAAPLAARKGVPLLLTNGTLLSDGIAEELRRLGTSKVVVVGSKEKIRDFVQWSLEDVGISVQRISGSNEAEIAANVLDTTSSVDTVAVVSDSAWPDAISATSLAFGKNTPPVLFTNKTYIPAKTLEALRRVKPNKIFLIGGTGVINPSVEQQLNNIANTKRLSGSNRLQTSGAVVQYLLSQSDDKKVLFFTSAEKYADALSSGPLAAHLGGAILLVPSSGNHLGADTFKVLDDTSRRWNKAYIMGGEAAINSSVKKVLQSR